MGVATHSPRLNWALGNTCSLPNQLQDSYRLQLSTDSSFVAVAWDTGRMLSRAAELKVPASLSLSPGTKYFWRVKSWSKSHGLTHADQAMDACESEWSPHAQFTTALWKGFANETKAVWSSEAGARYTFFRKDLKLVKKVTSAIAHVTAAQSGGKEKLLGAYRLYVNGAAVGIGPGRGEVNVGASNHTMYDIIDLLPRLSEVEFDVGSTMHLALQCFHESGDDTAKVK
jgi:hypothetical protein